jgi:acetylornithine/N-succinyldiaminopimelate aminotransferase
MPIAVHETLIEKERQYVMHTYARPDFVLARGEGMTLYDTDNRPYADWVAGIAVNALGYNDAGIRQAISSGLESGIIHLSNLYHNEPMIRLAEALVSLSFADRVFFANTGTEANEGAIKFARRAAYNAGKPAKTGLVTFSHAFHGRTMGSLSLTPKEKYQQPFRPLLPDVTVAEYNDIESARAAINDNTCAVIVEPIQGEGGVHMATPAFLHELRRLCDEHQAVLIFDEIQCGVGRTGELWAHTASGVTPDIMTVAKPLAAGLPIGAVLVKQWIADHISPGDHGTTFGGGPLVTTVARHVIERVSQPAFLAHVREVGQYLQDRLCEINSPLIAEVRGRGLMVGVEMRVDVAPVVKKGYQHGLLLVNAGTSVIRLVPPLIARKADVDHLVETLTTILEEMNG